ncbi:MAG: hypothetical protein EOP52_10340 [Sphingobacteriales bacterium]|nr:MAG: hypothetical protein EOP52_10340 [Sphingobacteriales bacterium]
MKKILLFAAFAAMTATAQAQTDKREMRQHMQPHERAEMQAQHMQKELGLSEDQTKRIMEVNMQMMPTPPDKNRTGDKQAMRAQRMEAMQKREAEYSQILTPDQMDRFRKMKEERMDKREERMNKMKEPRMK